MDRETILRKLHAQINVNGHVIGVSVGSGMTARYVAMGGADLLLALSAGRYRIMGRSSYAGYLCYGNNNDIVMEMGRKELFPIIKDVPILFGLMASDPSIHFYEYIKEIKEAGFAGIVNYPTLTLVDGQFREALEEEGTSYDQEVEAIGLAHHMGLFTVSFVSSLEDTKKMLEAGTDVICVHFGLTKGGFLGARKYVTLEESRLATEKIFAYCLEKAPNVIRMIYGGSASTPVDMQYMYNHTACQGYMGGSSFDRIPIERALYNTTRAFKSGGEFHEDDPMMALMNGEWNSRNYIDNIKKYIADNYSKEIHLGDLALLAHISSPHLSMKFKKEMGVSFSEYLIRFRIHKAEELLENSTLNCLEVAERVGYQDYAQFSKIFKKYVGLSPMDWRKQNEAGKAKKKSRKKKMSNDLEL